MAKKFKAKEEFIEAVYFDGDNVEEVSEFISERNSLTTIKELGYNRPFSLSVYKDKNQDFNYSFKSNANLYIPYFELPCYVYLKDNEFHYTSVKEFEKEYTLIN